MYTPCYSINVTMNAFFFVALLLFLFLLPYDPRCLDCSRPLAFCSFPRPSPGLHTTLPFPRPSSVLLANPNPEPALTHCFVSRPAPYHLHSYFSLSSFSLTSATTHFLEVLLHPLFAVPIITFSSILAPKYSPLVPASNITVLLPCFPSPFHPVRHLAAVLNVAVIPAILSFFYDKCRSKAHGRVSPGRPIACPTRHPARNCCPPK